MGAHAATGAGRRVAVTLATAHYNFILLSKHPLPPEWCQDAFFVIRVA